MLFWCEQGNLNICLIIMSLKCSSSSYSVIILILKDYSFINLDAESA